MNALVIVSCILFFTAHQEYAFGWQDVADYFSSHKEEAPIKKEIAVNAGVLVELEGIAGNVTVKSWNQPIVAIEAIKKGTVECLSSTSIRMTASPQVINVRTLATEGQACQVLYNLMVPKQASLNIDLKHSGDVLVKKVEGTLTVKTPQGSINLHGTIGNSTAKTTYGTINVKVKELPATSSLFLEVFKGTVELQVPKVINANLNAKTALGLVKSDVPITLCSQTTTLDRTAWARFKKEAIGMFGNGGAPVTIEVTKGNITITQQ